jgi:hypothetical protein
VRSETASCADCARRRKRTSIAQCIAPQFGKFVQGVEALEQWFDGRRITTLEMNFGLAAKEKPAGLRRRALINSLAV